MKKLTEERKAEIISNIKSNYRSTSLNSGILKVTETNILRRETPDGSEKRILTLRIQTDSDSPIYNDIWGDSYIERIDSNAFDESLQECNVGERIIYSFLDHKMDIENVISSTNREGTKFYKDSDNNYIYEFELDSSNPRHKQLMTMAENNEFKGNSFIFLPEIIEIEDAEPGSEYDYVVIQKKGELWSVDAVYSPFYPQNNITMKGAFMTEAQKREADAKAKAAADKAAADAKAKADQEAKEVAEQKAKEEADAKAKADQEAKEAAEQKAKEEADAKAKADQEAKEAAEQKAKESELDKNSKFKSLSIAEQRAYLQDPKLSARKIIESIEIKEAKADAAKRAAIADKLKKSKEQNMLTKEIEARNNMLTKLTLRGFSTVAKDGQAFANVKEDLLTALAERNAEYLDKFEILEDELKLFGLTRSGLTGQDNASGAAIIPVSTDPNVVGQIGITMPEFEGASRMPMKGLEEKKVAVDIDTLGVAPELEEGEEATEDKATVTKVQFTPKRYAKQFDYNPLLAEHANAVAQKTLNNTNSIKRSWLNGYYGSLLTHKAVTLGSLVATAGFTGGITKEAITASANISLAAGTGATDDTMDALILAFEARYGNVVEGSLKAEMKLETWTSIKAAAKKANNSVLIRVIKGKTMYGSVEVIVRDQYPEDASAIGNVPIILSVKANTKIYGMVMVQKDSIEKAFTAEQSTRLISGRGEAKLCDPHYTTFAAAVVA